MGKGLDDLKKALSSGVLARCYVFYGEESYLREFYTKRLIDCVYPTAEEAADLVVLQGKGLKPDDLLDALESVSMLSTRKLVIVRDLDIGKPDAKLKETIETLDVPDEVTLLFVYDTLEYKPDTRTKSYKHVASMAQLVNFEKQTEADLIPWLKRRFKALGKDINTDEARYLLFVCGASMTNLVQEVAKVASYAQAPVVSRADIDAVAAPVTETVVYALTDQLAAGRYDKAAATLNDLLAAREEPIMLLGLLGKQLRGLYAARLALETGRGEQGLSAVMGYRSSYQAKKMLDTARRLSLEWCRAAVTLAWQTDRQLKTSAVNKEDTLPFLLAQLAMNARA